MPPPIVQHATRTQSALIIEVLASVSQLRITALNERLRPLVRSALAHAREMDVKRAGEKGRGSRWWADVVEGLSALLELVGG